MQEDDGSGNFQNIRPHIQFFQQLVADLNSLHGHLQQPIWNGVRNDYYIQDSKIRFKIDGIYFHKDSERCHSKPDTAINGQNAYNLYAVEKEKSINIFYMSVDNSIPLDSGNNMVAGSTVGHWINMGAGY
jgi:hypothetical protein